MNVSYSNPFAEFIGKRQNNSQGCIDRSLKGTKVYRDVNKNKLLHHCRHDRLIFLCACGRKWKSDSVSTYPCYDPQYQ